MGIYTEFHFNVELKPNTPSGVIDILNYMLGNTKEQPQLTTHPLFKTERWKFMLIMDSYYFPADTHSTLRFDGIGKCYYLCIRCNLKNYDNEIDLFVEWITPYLAEPKGAFLGFKRHEENNEPTLIYKEK